MEARDEGYRAQPGGKDNGCNREMKAEFPRPRAPHERQQLTRRF